MFADLCYNMAGASAQYLFWTWDGGIQEDFKNFGVDPSQVCDFKGLVDDPTCENRGYKAVLHGADHGCNDQDRINKGKLYTVHTFIIGDSNKMQASLLPLAARKSTLTPTPAASGLRFALAVLAAATGTASSVTSKRPLTLRNSLHIGIRLSVVSFARLVWLIAG